MTDSNNDFFTACAESLLAGAGVGLALGLEHVGLWPIIKHFQPGDEIAPLFSYVVGTATIGAGMTGLAIRWRDPRLAIAFWAIAGSGGVVVGGLRLYRKWLRLEAESKSNQGYGAGQVAGVRSYTSEYKERPSTHRVA